MSEFKHKYSDFKSELALKKYQLYEVLGLGIVATIIWWPLIFIPILYTLNFISKYDTYDTSEK